MIKCVVPISGGKDSQVSLKMAIRHFDKSEIIGLFCDTQYEHPLTYAHIDKISAMYDVKIERVCEGDVLSLVRKYKIFPSTGARFCTDRLKLRPAKYFYRDLAKEQKQGFEVWLGLRSDESDARKKRYELNISSELYAPHELMPQVFPKYLAKMGVMFRLPILEWSTEDVFDFLGGEQNPLYALGSDRVGCFPCLASGDKAKEKAFALDDIGKAKRIEVVQLGREINQNIFTTKGGALRNRDTMVRKITKGQPDLFDAPCAICNM